MRIKRKWCLVLIAAVLAFSSIIPAQNNPEVNIVQAATPSAKVLGEAVKKAYGDDYLPSMKLAKSEIKDKFGVSSKLYSSAYAEVSMISAQVDTLVIFKAKDKDSKAKILKKLKSYRKTLINDTMQYPMNIPKIQASKIYKNGKYVGFIMLGNLSNKQQENESEEKQIKLYQEKNKIAIKAIEEAIS